MVEERDNGKTVARASGLSTLPRPIHRIDSVVAGGVVTKCGRHMERATRRGRGLVVFENLAVTCRAGCS